MLEAGNHLRIVQFGAVGAPDNPVRGLMSDMAAHCDGADHLATPGYPQSAADARGRLEACRTFIVRNLDAAVESAGRLVTADGAVAAVDAAMSPACVFNGRPGRAKCEVLDHFGQALHASQDFYSHSNWVDVAAPGASDRRNPPGLNHRGPAPWLRPDGATPFPVGLITGCYEGYPEALYCRGRVRHAVLNKDTGVIGIADPMGYVISVVLIVTSVAAMWMSSLVTRGTDYTTVQRGGGGLLRYRIGARP